MKHMRTTLRRLAFFTGVIMVTSSCDTRLPTQPGGLIDDVNRPSVKFALSTGSNMTVDVGAPVTLTVTASDNKGIASIITTTKNGAAVLAVDSLTVSPSALTSTRVIPLALSGLLNGDKVTVRTTVTDIAFNSKTDSLVLTIADTSAPAVAVTSTKSSRSLKGLDTLDIHVTASDSSGLRYAGYRLLRVRATDSLLVTQDSTLVPAGTFPRKVGPLGFTYILNDTLPVGPYALVAFAKDASGLKSGVGPTAAFNVVDVKKPTLTFIAPSLTAKLNVGDSLLVTARLQDNVSAARLTITGVSARGNAALGTADTLIRYAAVSAPTATTTFRAGLRDTTIQRYLKAVTPIDTLTDSLIVLGVLADGSDNRDTVRLKIKMVSGPIVTFLSPVPGDSATAGAGLTVSLRAVHALGVAQLGFRLQGDPSWPTKLDTTITQSFGGTQTNVTFTSTINIPANATPKSIITITPISADVNGQEGSSAATLIAIRAGLPPGPRVLQTVQTRVETIDSVLVTALGNGLTYVGFELHDATGALIRRDSVAITAPFPSTALVSLPLGLPSSAQGKKISVISFAYDQGGRIGYSLRAGATASQPLLSGAFVDSALVVYGRTFILPTNRNGTIADLAVDRARGNIFLSNINYGRLEVWQGASSSFDANGVVVGSQPWGMTMSRTALGGDTLYVANSGGTNLSRVFVGAANASNMREDLPNRILTRASYLFKVTEVRDASTQKIRLTASLPITFSDRPQYVQQSTSGRLYISTKPTAAAPQGTVRFMDPAAPAPDERFILDFATIGNDPNSYVIANLDAVFVTPAPATSNANDILTLCDHPSGTTLPTVCVSSDSGVAATIGALKFAIPTSDVDARANIDVNSLGLTDTTYAASSGDGKWISFGEGNKAPIARAFLLQDDGTVNNYYTYASPAINVLDLINNASDKVFGVALDKTGKTLGVHGAETYFASVTRPFTQRLQGKKSTFSSGSGIAFHPNADGTTTTQSDRLAFVASNNGTIEAVDIAYYDFTRASLATKFNLYGPLRASLPFPGDSPSVIFKLFGLSAKGLVIIDVTAADILPGP
ncbi:MAG: hypothetical protein ABJE47_02835 [bacterium]